MVISVDIDRFLELNSEPCKRAFHRLWMTGEGRYAYADDWNVLADCIQHIFDTMDKLYTRWEQHALANPHSLYAQRVFQQIRKLYMRTIKCRDIFGDYKRLEWGDTVTPEHTNVLIDTAKCLDDALEQGPRRGELVMVDEDDWGTASSLITDGTIVFANFGTKAMSHVEVRYFLENYNVVFAILMGRRLGEAGAFYDVFYTERYVGWRVLVRDRFRLRRGAFFDRFGVYDCHEPRGPDMPIGYLPAYWDPMVMALYKIPNSARWTWQYGVTGEYSYIHWGGLYIPPGTCVRITYGVGIGDGQVRIHPGVETLPIPLEELMANRPHDVEIGACRGEVRWDPEFWERLEIEFESRRGIGADILYGWSYARIGRGAVIELPLHGVVHNVDVFDWYIGAIAHVLLGEPAKCHIGPMPVKLRRVVWMTRHRPYLPHYWAGLSRWHVVDLRTKKS